MVSESFFRGNYYFCRRRARSLFEKTGLVGDRLQDLLCRNTFPRPILCLDFGQFHKTFSELYLFLFLEPILDGSHAFHRLSVFILVFFESASEERRAILRIGRDGAGLGSRARHRLAGFRHFPPFRVFGGSFIFSLPPFIFKRSLYDNQMALRRGGCLNIPFQRKDFCNSAFSLGNQIGKFISHSQ